MNPTRADRILRRRMPPLHARLERRSLERLQHRMAQRLAARDPRAGAPDDRELHGLWLDLLQNEADQALESIYRIQGRRAEFEARYAHAATEEERRFHVLEFARDLGSEGMRLRADRRAFRRWFGRDAVLDRCHKRVGELERYLAFCLERTGRILEAHLASLPAAQRAEALRAQHLENLVEPLLAYPGDPRPRTAAFDALHHALTPVPGEARDQILPDRLVHFIERAALDADLDTWLQLACLRLLARLRRQGFLEAARHRLAHPEGTRDDPFVRAGIVRILCEELPHTEAAHGLLERVPEDPAPFVRRTLARHARRLPGGVRRGLLERLMHEDPEPAVRRSALQALEQGLGARDPEWALTHLVRALREPADDLTHRAVLRQVERLHARLAARDPGLARRLREAVLPVLAELHGGADSPRLRRWCARTREHLWVRADPGRRRLRAALARRLRHIEPGRSVRLPRRLLNGHDLEEVGRILADLTHEDHPASLSGGPVRGWRLHRGFRFRFRLWRLLYELGHPAPDKRQAYPHWIGRVFYGSRRFPSGRLAELTPTRVPGEPVFLPEEDGWRPELPLPDDVLSALDEPLFCARVQYWTAEGRTSLLLPRGPWRRLVARTVLTLRFAHLARLRNQEGRGGVHGAYARALGRLGIGLEHEPHPEPQPWREDPMVRRAFPALFPWPGAEAFGRIEDYFFSLYENTLAELAAFAGLVGLVFFGNHVRLNRRLRRARRALPLVIGGWGTRGKSGTERLKAALFNALGYTVVSKTTGTEAMFLLAHRHGSLRELPLFRPYDKATIWEQAKMVDLARDLSTDVFLWECMALTPSYVRIMQQDWMRDDLSTITNTYPDHEDIQGPAGIDIPKVMTEFIPPHATLLTSEEQMLPILRTAARGRGTRTRAVDWLDVATLTPDVLARFPYEEHPANVALVTALARELGIDEAYALKEMADRVLPDIGVLKVFPPAPVQGRRLQFVNGMSANERIGFLGSWERTGFARELEQPSPGTWIVTVINNRADRPARSQVFARVVVEDIAADLHLVVGTEVDGFLRWVREAWDDWAHGFSLFGPGRDPLETLRRAARRLRVVTDPDALQTRLEAMLRTLGVELERGAADPERLESVLRRHAPERAAEALGWLQHWRNELAAFERVQATIGTQLGEPHRADETARQALWGWLAHRLVPVRDPHVDAESLMRLLLRRTPPGYRARIMGCQNIKGPGVELVHLWQQWERCHQACEHLRTGNAEQLLQALRTLAAMPNHGLLCREALREALDTAKRREQAQNEYAESQILLIEQQFERERAGTTAPDEAGAGGGWLVRLVDAVEAFLDAGDAVRRRRSADRIYRELAAERISQDQAVSELQALNRRQKGGWLRQRLLGRTAP